MPNRLYIGLGCQKVILYQQYTICCAFSPLKIQILVFHFSKEAFDTLIYIGVCESHILGDEFEQYIQKFRSKTLIGHEEGPTKWEESWCHYLIRYIFVCIAQTLTVK